MSFSENISANVVIVGRPNVGKSSLFNRLLGRRRSVVLDTPGVTRDRIVEPLIYQFEGKTLRINLIDTGGIGKGSFEDEIRSQVATALAEAHLVLWVFDLRVGLVREDEEVGEALRRSGILKKVPVIGIANKADNESMDEMAAEFYGLGLNQYLAVSAEHNLGISDLKQLMIAHLVERAELDPPTPDFDPAIDDEALGESFQHAPRTPRIAIVGQPNVGKSTLINAILGEKRTIVSPIAGTTVDSIDTEVHWRGKDLIFVDTAGIRRKDKTEAGIEVLSVVQTRKALERADLAVLMMDAEKGVYDQDEKIAGLIEEMGCSVVMVLNKWDLQQKNGDFSQKQAEEQIREKIRFLGYSPLIVITAKDGWGLDRLFRMIETVLEQRWVKVGTKDLSEFIRSESEIHNPMNAKFYLSHQTGKNPPTFVCHVSDPRKIHFSLSRYLIKAIRQKWGFYGTPIRLNFLKAKNSSEKRDQ